MTFSGRFRVNEVEDDDSLPGRVRVVSSSAAQGEANGLMVSGELSALLTAGTAVSPGDTLHVTGWIEHRTTAERQ